MRQQTLAFLKELVNTPLPSGYEERAAEVYRTYTKGFADEVRTEVTGSVFAILNPGAPQRVMLAGHMDEIGYQIHYIDSDGFLYFKGIGGHDHSIALGQRVWVHGAGGSVAGVIGRKPVHLLEATEREKASKFEAMFIDIGAKTGEEAQDVVGVGDCATIQSEFQEILGDRVIARAFDNRVGSVVVAEALRLLKEDGGLDPGVGVYAVATVQEEVGLLGARTSAFSIDAQSGLAVDVDFAIDHPGVSKTRYGASNLGDGPTVTRGARINPIVFSMLKSAASTDSIPIQISAEPGGTGTDADAMQMSRGGMATGLIGVPLRYMHTPVEMISLVDVENAARLMSGYCRLVRPDTDFTPRILP